MAASGPIDAGVIIALLDRRDAWHLPSVNAYRNARLPLLTSEAVLTEVFHLVGDDPFAVSAVWKLIRAGGVVLATIDHHELMEIEALMTKYADRPMDFADATLVYLARREELQTVLTIGHSDFETYRISGNKRFRIAPARRI